MQNQEIFKKLLDLLNDDLAFYADMIKEVSTEMIKENFTKYPVFIAHQHVVSVGEPILLREDYARDFSINASTLEELVSKKLVLSYKKEEFIANYKNAKEFMCVLLVTAAGAHFVFAPYKIKANKNASS
jgi:hypothetical protein